MSAKVQFRYNDIKLSKKLAYLLRHSGIKEGLTIKSNGFVTVDEVLLKLLHGYTIDDIERVVRNNDKQRFTLNKNNGILEIKANQGHSISLVNNLSLKILNSINCDVIHGTYIKHWNKIKREGLSRMQRNHIHFAKGLNFICGLRQSAEIFIYIDFEKAIADDLLFFESENGIILCPGDSKGLIKPKYFLKVLSANEYALQGHLAGKKHLKKVEQAQVAERSIFISPLPKFTPRHDLINFFQQFGTIKWYRFGPNYVIIEFDGRKSADTVLNKPIWISNTKLDIKKRIMYNDPLVPKSKKQCNISDDMGLISYNNIKHIFDKKTTFNEQLTEFLNTVQLTDMEIETKYESVYTQLDNIFKTLFPKCKTHKFGSTQTGLCFKECDLDINIDIGEPIYETKSAPDSWTMNKIFKEVRRMMHRMNRVFSNIISIPKAKTPIIKFCHIPTNISCDISFKNGIGIYKSYLIKHCITFDTRLKPFIMFIKYWGKCFRISGSGKISNYALILLIIFYLQQPSVNIIPPLIELQKACQPQIVNGWQVNFNRDIMLSQTKNNSTIPQLLHDFFKFYATFEFKSKVICLLDGMTHSESKFKETESLPSYMDRYKVHVKEDESVNKLSMSKPMCVQDPIELSHNVTANIPLSVLDLFIKYCSEAAEICVISSKTDYRDLMNLLFTAIPQNKVNTKKFNVIISADRFCKNNSLNKSKKDENIEMTKTSQEQWYTIIFDIVKDCIEKVFKTQVSVVTVDTEPKQQKTEILSDVHTEEGKEIILHCVGNYRVWHKRKITSQILDPSLNCLEKEAGISDRLVEEFDKNSNSKINLNFTCEFQKKTNPLQVILTLHNQNTKDKIFQEFAQFAKHKLERIIHQTVMHKQYFNNH